MGTKTVVETKRSFELKSLPDLRRLAKWFVLFLAVLTPIIISYLISPTNIVIGATTLLSYGVVGLFIFQTIYGLILLKK